MTDWIPSVRAIAVLAAVVLVAAVTTLLLAAEPQAPPQVAVPAEETPAGGVTSTPASPDDVAVDIVGCEEPPETFAALCEVHSLLHEHYVDPVDDEALAEAARDALRTLARQGDLAGGPPPDGAVPCAAPTEGFNEVCDLYAEVLGETGAAEAEVAEGLVLGMVEGLGDPNSAYLPPRINEILREDMGGQVEGIGALVTTRDPDDPDEPCRTISETCHLVVVSPIEGGPADEAGLRPDDRIISFDGTPVSGETIHEAVARGRGPAGTEVDVEIEREGQRFEVTIERRAVDVPQVESESLEDDVGYLRIIRFAEGGDEEFRRHLNDLIDDGADRFILDLRNNPGGLTGTTSDIADEFLGPGVIFSLEGADGPIDRWTATTGGAAVDSDVVVLINRASVSAAEILAAALSQQGGATLIGETTAGKGTAQRSFEVSGGGAVRITVARWLTPEGSSVEGDGVVPDIEIEDAIGEEPDDDPVLRRAVEHLVGERSG